MRLTTTPLLLSYKRSIGVFVLLLLVVLGVTKSAEAQNYITEGFESSTFPPSGWKVITSGGTSTHGTTSWARQTSGGVSTPSVTAHGGSAMAWYNSYWISSTGVSSLITPAMNFAAYTGGYNQVSFWYYNYTASDYLDVLVNTSDTDAGSSVVSLGSVTLSSTSTGWHQYIYTIPSSFNTSPNVYVIFQAHSAYGEDENIDDISIDHIPPCTGTPSVALSPAGFIGICAGGKVTLNGGGTIVAADQYYQWQQASSVTGPWTNIAGATNTSFTTPAISTVTYFRLKDSCGASGGVGYSGADTVAPAPPAYASLPYVQSFESWQNFCDQYDVPGSNWANSPSTGDASWRRDDQGCTYGGWTSSGCYGPGSSYSVNSYSPTTAAHGGSHAARFHSSPNYGSLAATSSPWSGNLDLYVNCSGPGNKLLQFFFKNQPYPYSVSSFLQYNNDSLDVFLSTNGGTSFTQIWGADTANEWKKVRIDIASTSANTIIRFVGKRIGGDPAGTGYTYNYTDIGLDSVYVGPACNSLPAMTTTPSGTITGCPGAQYIFNIGSLPLAGGLTYQWQQAVTPFSSFSAAAGGSGSNSYSYNTPALFDSIKYRAILTCPYSGISDTTSVATIAMSGKPSYAAINLPAPAGPGYHYSFENWNNRCSSKDAPVVAASSGISNWGNFPSTGNSSWRREDQGSSASWSYTSTSSPYMYSPASVDSSHSARFMTYYRSSGAQIPGNLYLFLDCSTITGTKELQYYVNTYSPTSSSYSVDTLITSLSTDGGATFTTLRKDFYGGGLWNFANVDIPSNSATTVIKFQGVMSSNYSYGSGIGLDNVKVLPPCNGKPVAGILKRDSVCAGTTFTKQLSGTSQSAGLSYEWQESADSITWTDVIGDTTMIATLSYSSNTYLRVIVKCRNSGLKDTSNIAMIYVKPFYKCYCNPVSKAKYADIYGAFGNVSIVNESDGDTVMSNTTASYPVTYNPWAQSLYIGGSRASLMGHTDFTDTFPAPIMYPDSLYRFYITEVCTYSFYSGYPINVYIDYDHSGTFDAASSGELVFNKTVSSAFLPTVTDTLRIPHDAQLGLTGMRAIMGIYYSSPLDPCGTGSTYQYGEVRDYLINIDYRPCSGKLNAGIIASTDSIMCKGYSLKLTDTTHEYHQSAITWSWQYSPDGKTWGDIPGTTKRDTLTQMFNTTVWYRLQMVCLTTHDTSYSNVMKIKEGEAYQCYCFSAATGGNAHDSSDIGAFTFGTFIMNKKGPHLLNPAATDSHAGYVDRILDLYVDSTYPVGLYHILKSATHGDSKVTLFIDYNNNLRFDLPDERVWTAYTSSSDWYITASVKIPDIVVADVPTGMRLILNNNVGANTASDEGCGAYTSGETMDFVVRFNRAWTSGVGSISNIENLMMYPNPSDGKFKVSFSSQHMIKNLEISVTNMTGQEVFTKSYTNSNGEFNTEIDLSGAARGVYFVTFIADGERMIRKMILK